MATPPTPDTTLIEASYEIKGVVQGVGFRPTVYRLARAAGLGGWIQNRRGTVRLVIQGDEIAVSTFAQEFKQHLPPNARIDTIALIESRPLVGQPTPFSIRESDGNDRAEVAIPADLATCQDCVREIFSPDDRRYGYPFTTCTNCGPRYTVVSAMPYDRERTSLADFPLCPMCRKEYDNPNDRRFHAESLACPDCGPQLALMSLSGEVISNEPLQTTRRMLHDGAIVGIRAIGGYQLAANAFSRVAIAQLRERKHRPDKPFAVMARDLTTVRQYCNVSQEEAQLLTSPEAPIVILDVQPGNDPQPPLPMDLLSPDTDTLGVMLPSSPLHHLLFTPLCDDPTPALDILLMTSGNRGGEPICITNPDAQERLHDIADALLMHDREITLRNDDSLVISQVGAPQLWRRARGYAPNAIHVTHNLPRTVLAMGAELKNTIALGYDTRITLSPHIGDLETEEALQGLDRVVDTFPRFLERTPDIVAVDLHPDMHSTRLGEAVARDLDIPVRRVQHHHAHALACLAEHDKEECIAIVFDGTGLGPDGTIWGGEALEASRTGYRRLATFRPAPLPGGDVAVREPTRQLIARWLTNGLAISDEWLDRLGISRTELDVWTRQVERQINCASTRAAGRVFDSVAAALGLAPHTVTYEGQAAIRLEAAARHYRGAPIPLPFDTHEQDGLLEIDWAPCFAVLHDTDVTPESVPQRAFSFHHALARAACTMVEYSFAHSPLRTVALSGGVFMNRTLTDLLVAELQVCGADVLLHHRVPPNDGGIALGQAYAGEE